MTDEKKDNNSSAAIRPDGYANVVTGFGGPPDKSSGTFFQRMPRLGPEELASWYEQDALASRIIDRLPDDATREGFALTGEDRDFNWNGVMSELEDLDALNSVADGWRWARLMGGSLIVMAINDGRTYDKPLDMKNIRGFSGLQVVESTFAQPSRLGSGLGSASFRKPIHYEITPTVGKMKTRKVHHTRVIRIDGVKVPPSFLIRNNGWGPSVLQRVATQLQQLGEVMGYSRSIAHNISVPLMQFDGFRDQLLGSAKGKQQLERMIETIRMTMDNLHILAMDKNDSAGEMKRDVTGLEKLVAKFVDALVRATDMPRTVILGEQPSGLGASADSEIRSWYDHVHAKQRLVLTPVINRLLEIILAGRARRNPDMDIPSEWQVEWNPLWQPNDQEMAQTRLTNAQADQIYFSMASMSVSEIRTRLEDEGTIKDATVEVPLPAAPVMTGSPPGGSGALAAVSDIDPAPDAAEPSQKPVPDDVVDVREAAKRLGVATRTLTRQMQLGNLPFWQFGSRRQVSLSEVMELGRREVTSEDAHADRAPSKKNPLTQPFPEKAATALGKQYQQLNAVAMVQVRRHLIPAIRSGNEARITKAIGQVQAGVNRGYTDTDIAKDAAKTADIVSDGHADEFFAGLAATLGVAITGTDRPGAGSTEGATSIEAIESDADGEAVEVAVVVNEEAIEAEGEFVDRNVEFMGKLRSGVAAGLGIWLAREIAGQDPDEAAAKAAKSFAATGVPSSVGELVVHLPAHARLIADDQTGTLNLDLNRIRAGAAGVDTFRWITQGDADVRPEHEEIENQVFTWAAGAPTLGGALPGEPINCRCWPGFIADAPAMRAAENFVLVV